MVNISIFMEMDKKLSTMKEAMRESVSTIDPDNPTETVDNLYKTFLDWLAENTESIEFKE